MQSDVLFCNNFEAEPLPLHLTHGSALRDGSADSCCLMLPFYTFSFTLYYQNYDYQTEICAQVFWVMMRVMFGVFCLCTYGRFYCPMAVGCCMQGFVNKILKNKTKKLRIMNLNIFYHLYIFAKFIANI